MKALALASVLLVAACIFAGLIGAALHLTVWTLEALR
jgi:hypothetical protein